MRHRLVAALVLVAACGRASYDAPPAAAQSATPPPVARTTPAQDTSAQVSASRRTAIVTAAERIAPAVVSVNIVKRERQTGGM